MRAPRTSPVGPLRSWIHHGADSCVIPRHTCCRTCPHGPLGLPVTPSVTGHVSVLVTANIATPLAQMSHVVGVIDCEKAYDAPLTTCVPRRKNTHLDLSAFPTSGRSSDRSASKHIRFQVLNSGWPKNGPIPAAWKAEGIVRDHPAVALDSPPNDANSTSLSSMTR